jgi:hypothetical protein
MLPTDRLGLALDNPKQARTLAASSSANVLGARDLPLSGHHERRGDFDTRRRTNEEMNVGCGSIPELRDAGKRSPFPGIVAATQITARADFLSDSAFPVDCPLLSHQTLSSRIQLVILPAKTAFKSRLLNDADPEFLGATAT